MPTYSGATYFGDLEFTIPYTDITGKTQSYLNDLEYKEGITGTKTFSFMAIWSSRLSEKKLYGSDSYSGITATTKTISGVTVNYTGYTIDGLSYEDYDTGYTQITGKTPSYLTASGSTIGNDSDFATEYVINKMLTRNEHFLGFIEQPRVYSDIFVERGKLGVMELNLRLGEIDNMGELSVYGNGYFNVKKQ